MKYFFLKIIVKDKGGNQFGFTLLELILTVGIIAAVSNVVFVAVDPAERFAQARNAQRWQEINSIMDSIQIYGVDNGGVIPSGITATPTEICKHDLS